MCIGGRETQDVQGVSREGSGEPRGWANSRCAGGVQQGSSEPRGWANSRCAGWVKEEGGVCVCVCVCVCVGVLASMHCSLSVMLVA